ncbi:hypothetical protein GCM10010349_72530 [Streptomyces flavofungini]|nr:hypothetical protein GCM10010349_72530 [Streptomyces flavofungini]
MRGGAPAEQGREGAITCGWTFGWAGRPDPEAGIRAPDKRPAQRSAPLGRVMDGAGGLTGVWPSYADLVCRMPNRCLVWCQIMMERGMR